MTVSGLREKVNQTNSEHPPLTGGNVKAGCFWQQCDNIVFECDGSVGFSLKNECDSRGID